MALVAAVAQANEPVARVAPVIARLFSRLLRERGELRVVAEREPLELGQCGGVEEHLAHDRLREVAVRLLDEQAVAEGRRSRQLRKAVGSRWYTSASASRPRPSRAPASPRKATA